MCDETEFQCSSGYGCIDQSLQCNAYMQCADDSDEANCGEKVYICYSIATNCGCGGGMVVEYGGCVVVVVEYGGCVVVVVEYGGCVVVVWLWWW